jgi:hypothetical protein
MNTQIKEHTANNQDHEQIKDATLDVVMQSTKKVKQRYSYINEGV